MQVFLLCDSKLPAWDQVIIDVCTDVACGAFVTNIFGSRTQARHWFVNVNSKTLDTLRQWQQCWSNASLEIICPTTKTNTVVLQWMALSDSCFFSKSKQRDKDPTHELA